MLAQVAQKYPRLLSLGDLLKKNANQLTIEDFVRVADALGVEVPVGPELQQAGLALLKGKGINEVSDMIRHPDSLEELVVFFRRGFGGLKELHQSRALERSLPQEGAPALAFLA